ncbi:MAG: hypothetical protein EBS13_04780 [Verrucomicrobia bacterium]|nr:hypothetical protein [Verrucomicrobiota bacterium]
MGDTGCLYLVASPIGNLGDFTDRGKKVLSECDLIACEDTRVTKKLLSHLELSKPMISYREENERKQSEFLAGEISKGQRIALLSIHVRNLKKSLRGAAISRGCSRVDQNS